MSFSQKRAIKHGPYKLSNSPTFSNFSYFLGVFLFFSYFFSESSYFYVFAIKCQNNFSHQEKLGLLESASFTLQLLGFPQTPGLIKCLEVLVSFCLFHSFLQHLEKKGEHVMLFLPQLIAWIYPKAYTFCHKLISFLHFSQKL